MFNVPHFGRELQWPAFAALLCAFAIFVVTLMRNRSDVAVEKSGHIARAVTELGGPCLAIKQLEYAKYGPLGLGDCEVRYTNNDKTAATVTLQFARNNSWVLVTADVVTDGGPLASLKWRVTRSAETLRDAGGKVGQ
jgi:hypothetical protein